MLLAPEKVNDEMTGTGKMTYVQGGVYDGEWKSGKRHGQGKMKFSDGDVYQVSQFTSHIVIHVLHYLCFPPVFVLTLLVHQCLFRVPGKTISEMEKESYLVLMVISTMVILVKIVLKAKEL